MEPLRDPKRPLEVWYISDDDEIRERVICFSQPARVDAELDGAVAKLSTEQKKGHVVVVDLEGKVIAQQTL